MKPLVFISHINSEASLAIWLKDTIKSLLLGGIDFFVSSDRSSIVGGDKWLVKIESALKRAPIFIVICSEESISRPWINFEAGGAWMAGKRVIPVCHSGMSPSGLPEPLRSLQAYDISSPNDLYSLIELLAKEADLHMPKFEPELILKSLQSDVFDILDKSPQTTEKEKPYITGEESKDFESDKIIPFRGVKLPTFEVNVLRELEKGREKKFKPVAEIGTHTMGVIVEKERVAGLCLGKWGYSWGNEKAQIVPESIGRLTALKTLDMSYADITYIPESLGNLKALERLNMKSNQLAVVPDCICNLTNLNELELDSNSLTSLPDCIGNLQKLKNLVLEHNRIDMLPDSFGELRSLEYLDLWENQKISSFPEPILKLQSLKELSINGNSLKTIPEAIDNLKGLITLRLDMNELITLPESIGNLQSLETLTLGWNKLGTIPDSVGNLKKLRKLDLWDAKLKAFPRCICNLTVLEKLGLGNNKIQSIPEEIENLKLLRHLQAIQ